jgi:hypothetical protein
LQKWLDHHHQQHQYCWCVVVCLNLLVNHVVMKLSMNFYVLMFTSIV